jgi:pimeloyl-ACP methyl ester carboxylesterase
VPQLAAITRVCLYDRAGLGQSDPAPDGVRTIQDSVNDLRALLNAVPLGCPCVFAGESWGGSIVRLFAGQFPGDVAGLVFVDTVPPGFTDQFVTLVKSDEPGFASLMGADNPERMDQLNSLRQADAAPAPPPVPIVVITHGLVLGFPLNFPVDQLEAAWRDGQEAYARVNHARFVIAATSGNSVVHDQPEVVTDAVQLVVAAARDPAYPTALVVHRFDAAGAPLPGSCFQIYLDAGGGTRGEYRGGACDTDGDGVVDGAIPFAPLPAGAYVVQEVKPPDGVPAAADLPVAIRGLVTEVDVKSVAATPTGTVTATATVTATP